MTEIIRPFLGALSRRLGTALAAWLLAGGLPADFVEAAVVHVVALLALVSDLVLSVWRDRARDAAERLMMSRE